MMTQGPSISIYPLGGDPGWVTQITTPGTMDEDETYIYLADASNFDERTTSRIIRINVVTGAVEIWFPPSPEVLPAKLRNVCFNSDFTKMYGLISGSSNVIEIDFETQAVTTLGSLGTAFSHMQLVPGTTNDFYFSENGGTDLLRGSISDGGVITAPTIWQPEKYWTCSFLVPPSGAITRGMQRNGPNTNGPIVTYNMDKFPLTDIRGGMYHDESTPNAAGPAYSNKFIASSLATNGDSSIVYFTSQNRLMQIDGDQVDILSTTFNVTSNSILGYAYTRDKIVARGGLEVNIWTDS
jgi:hypothetical protein